LSVPRNVSCVVLIMVFTMMAGCATEPERPPILVAESLRYWFEGDLVIFNFTLRNQSDFTPGPPVSPNIMLDFRLDQLKAKPEPGRRSGNDLVLDGFPNVVMTLSPSPGEPLRDRYYAEVAAKQYGEPPSDRTYGPVTIPPDATLQLELAFLPPHFSGSQGYYTLNLLPQASYPDGNPDFHSLQTGCFNHDTPEFYGIRDNGPDCDFFNSAGRWTNIGVPADGVENTGKPIMIHDPPADVPDAH
jgi:hypothetical protein